MSTATTSSTPSRQQNAFYVHTSPTDFLATTQAWLLAHERRANIIFPHAEKLREQEQSGTLSPGHFWVTAWSASPPTPASTTPARRGPHLDFVLACTEGHMGTYPLFLFSTHEIVTLPEQWLDQCMHQLAQKLMTLVDPARVFSIFGQERAVQMLCRHWSNLTGFRPVSQPYYEASSTYCTPETFVPTRPALEAGHVMRKAVQSDVDQVAGLCQEFAEDSVSSYFRFSLNIRFTSPQPPFTLSMDRARQEAQYLVHHGLVWVYLMDGALSTIVAVTRSSPHVAGITKVYTSPQFRRRGCADRLVAHVCEQSVHLYLSTVPSNSNRLLPGNSKPASRTPFSLLAILSLLHVSITGSDSSAWAPPKASIACKIPTWNGGWRSVSRALALAIGDLFPMPLARLCAPLLSICIIFP